MRNARLVLASAGALLSAAAGCGRPEPTIPQAPPPLRLPGGMTAPDGMPVDVSGDSAAVVYYWIPLEGYPPSAEDLAWIEEARHQGHAVMPVQFDEDSRNAAQTQVNDLGIPLPVYLADSSLAAAIPDGILPVAVLFARGAEPRVETGTGCAERLLGL